MTRTFRRTTLVALLVPFLTLAFQLRADAAQEVVRARAPELPEVARAVPVGGALRIVGLDLDAWGPVELELERFSVFAPNATIEVVGGPAVPVPDVAYFRGRLGSDPDSVVMMAIPARGAGKVHGIVAGASGMWMIEDSPGSAALRSRKVDPATDLAGRTFDCGVERMDAVQLAPGRQRLKAQKSSVQALGLPANINYTATMIIDTDYEYWLKFWNLPANTGDPLRTAAAATEYLGDLIAYASTAYERDVQTNLLIVQVRLFADNSDPYSENDDFCGCDGFGKLDEVQAVWSGNATPRTLVHFISGKTEGCGCGYTGGGSGVLCSQGDGYATSSSIGTGFDIDDPGFSWEGMVIAHEIGHNFGSPHTHNYCGEFGNPSPIDACVDDATDGVANCAGDNNRDLPGLGSLTGGQTSDNPGTIMSYCHQQAGGFQNIAHSFGLNHPYGVAAWRQAQKMLGNVQAAACMAVQYSGSDLRVVKDCKPDQPMPAGDSATCTITIENLGPDTALGATAIDQYLSNGTFSFGAITASKGGSSMPAGTCTTTPNPQDGSGAVTCELGDIDAGHIVVVAIEVTADAAQNINDRVTVSSDSPDGNQFNNVAEDEVNVMDSADLDLTKSDSPDPVIAGANLTYTLSVTNHGPSPATNVIVRDLLPAGVSVVSVSSNHPGATCQAGEPGNAAKPSVCTFDTMADGASRTMTIVVTVLPETTGILHNDASVSSETHDPDNSNNVEGESTTIESQADLSVTKSDNPDPAVAGSGLTYEVVVTNGGPSTAVGVTLTDSLPAEVTYTGSTISNGTGTCALLPMPPNTLSCDLNDLDPGEWVKVVIETTVNADVPDSTAIVNSASVGSATADPNLANNSAAASTTVLARADLAIAKAASIDTSNPAPRITYTVAVTNLGSSDAQGVVMVDQLPLDPQKIIYVFDTGNGACSYFPAAPVPALDPAGGSHYVQCSFGTIPAGSVVSVDIIVDARGSVRAISNFAGASSTTVDPDTSNNLVRKDVRVKGGPGKSKL